MKKSVLVFLLIVSYFLPVSYGQGPDPKDHVFNIKLPNAIRGEMITLTTKDDALFQAYQILSKTPSESSILLIHEWWGLNDHMKSTADQLALLGYNALVVDLFDSKVTSDPNEASKLIQNVKLEEAQKKVEAALDYLALKSKKIGVMGWCFGGGWALKASLARPRLVQATVIYYGELITEPKELQKLKGPVLGIFAKQDKWIVPQWVESFKLALEKAGVLNEIYSYDADHAFANPSNKHFNEADYRDAWAKTLEFLKKNLK